MAFALKAQHLKPFYKNKKWGFKVEEKVIIVPQYDTVFSFDKTGQIALVAVKNDFNTFVNPLTGEQEVGFDYSYITIGNKKMKFLAEYFPDSMDVFLDQQELKFNYLDSSDYVKILFQNKLYLCSKKGHQLSKGFDNILQPKMNGFFETENYIEADKKVIRIKGLIDSTGLEVVKCKYKAITINKEDSSIYCCSAVYNNTLNDDVYDFKGKLIYSNKKHIEFFSKKMIVLKSYEPKEEFIVENTHTMDTYTLEGNQVYYLKNNKLLLVNKDSWYIVDLLTKKRQKVNKDDYFFNLNYIIEH